jgi:hypothetical protein
VLLRAIAPRVLVVTQARDDLWANPAGTRHVLERVRDVYVQHGRDTALTLVWRDGGHAQQLDDWCVVFDGAARLAVAAGAGRP